MLLRPALKRHLVLRHMAQDGILVLGERGSHLLGDGLTQSVAVLADGSLTTGEIIVRLQQTATAAEVLYALGALEDAGLIAEAGRWNGAPSSAYWHALGTDPDAAAGRLRETTIRLLPVGDAPVDACRAALERHGLRVSDDGGIPIVLADNYLHPSLARFNGQALIDGMPWVLARLTGLDPWIGPLFEPGQTGCWECLAHRLRGNRPMEEIARLGTEGMAPPPVFRSALPSTIELAAGVLATLLRTWIVTGEAAAFAGVVTSVDTTTAATTRHKLTRRPQCPVCGDGDLYARQVRQGVRLEARPNRFMGDGGYRAVRPDLTVRRFEDLVGPITGIVRDVRSIATGDNAAFAVYAATHFGPPRAHPAASLRVSAAQAGGKGKTDTQARASVLGEAIERTSGLYQGDEPRIAASFESLGAEAIDPNACMLFSDRQFAAGVPPVPPRLDPGAVIDWSPVWSLTHGVHRYLPTQYLYFAYQSPAGQMFCPADSNGNACGNTLEEAVLQGCLELIERDAVGIWWYNRIRRPALDLAGFDDPYVRGLVEQYAALQREIWVLDLTTDLGVPVYAAVSRRCDGPSEQIMLGFGAHLDGSLAVGRALTELNQILAFVEAIKPTGLRPDMRAWLDSATVASEPHLAPAPGPRFDSGALLRPRHGDLRDAVLDCQQKIEAQGMEVLVLDQTRPDLGVPVVKVIVPGLRHFWTRFAPGRLFDVPVRMGWLPGPLPEDGLNPMAMFL